MCASSTRRETDGPFGWGGNLLRFELRRKGDRYYANSLAWIGIAVARSAFGKGVGFALMKSFESRARALQMASLRLSVYPDNSPARRLYERCGWRPLQHSESSTGTIYYGLVIR